MDKRGRVVKRSKKKESEFDKYFDSISKQSSQYNSRYYDKLKEEGRLHRFLEIIVKCSLAGMTKASTVDELNKSFCDYFNVGGLTVKTFDKMIMRYPDIQNAWTSSYGVSNANASLLKDGLMRKFIDGELTYEQMFELLKYFDQGIFNEKNSSNYIPTKRSISNIKMENISKEEDNNKNVVSEETTNTLNSINSMLSNIKVDDTK